MPAAVVRGIGEDSELRRANGGFRSHAGSSHSFATSDRSPCFLRAQEYDGADREPILLARMRRLAIYCMAKVLVKTALLLLA